MEEKNNTENLMLESNPEQTAVDIKDAISWEENVQEMAEALSNDPDFQKLKEQEADLMEFLEAYRKAKKKCERKAVSKKEKKKKKAKRRMAKQSKR